MLHRKNKRIKIEQAEAALTRWQGNISAASQDLHCARTTLYRKINEHEALQHLVNDMRESRVDRVEDLLMERMEGGDTTAMIFFLKTQGQARGDVEKPKDEGNNDFASLILEAAKRGIEQ